jgi:hypothetical protein
MIMPWAAVLPEVLDKTGVRELWACCRCGQIRHDRAAIAEDLVSHGYVVVTIDSPRSSSCGSAGNNREGNPLLARRNR